jgi:hypothetical protein
MKWSQMKRRDAYLERELRSDLELEEQQREGGLSLRETCYAALRAFGKSLIAREESRRAVALNRDRFGSTLGMRVLRILGELTAHVGGGRSRALSISVALAGFFLLILPSSQVLASLHPAHPADSFATKLQSSSATPETAVEPVGAAGATPAERVPSAQLVIAQESVPPEKPQAESSTVVEPKSNYIDRMKAAGYNVDLDKYVEMKIRSISPDYARQMAQAGLGKLSADDLLECKFLGVTPEYIAQLKQQGLNISSVHDVTAFRMFKVTPEFIAGMKAAGYPNLEIKQLFALHVHGVGPEYARFIAEQFRGATIEDIIHAKSFNIDANLIESAKKLGFKDLNLNKLIQIRISGLIDDWSLNR